MSLTPSFVLKNLEVAGIIERTSGETIKIMKSIKSLFAIIAVALGGFSHVQAQSFLTNGLVAYYPFNGNANDASGNGNNGSLVGGDYRFLSDRLGFTNSSLWLNSTSIPAFYLQGAYVAVSESPAFNFTNDFTLSIWVNFTNNTPLP